ncbi:bacterio-opsin activator domain-containing protein [Haloarchaeobius amylolyticus]|uniref:bacterio-opsin activator domain-containing protein n=1 Tax=Haloarchaeobius amylolyticus TaxID=1198296 RepID=UPI00226DEC06|nr:bacterio-opsin activator domain-containing protein [Haloarchaeobius amylolyticus]
MKGHDSLTLLLIEDSAGDARYIQELLHDATELEVRANDAGRPDDPDKTVTADDWGPTLQHETRLQDGLDRLDDDPPDAVLLDLNLPDSRGLETVDGVREYDETVPIVVLTGVQDRDVGMEALKRGAEEYLVKGEINASLLVRSVHHAIERRAQERELEQQRDRLATLNSLNELVHEISHLAIGSTTREEVESLACEHLAAADLYDSAWFAEAGGTDDVVTARAQAGIDRAPAETLADEAAPTRDDDPVHPIFEAIRSRSVSVAQDVQGGNPWEERVREAGVRAVAAIPVVHEETAYGVVVLRASASDAFDSKERQVIGRLGEVLGHAINAINRKQALLGEEVVELQVQIPSVLDQIDVALPPGESITIDRTIPLGDGEFLQYGTVPADGVEVLHELVDRFDHHEAVEIDDPKAETSRFELRLSEPPVIWTVAEMGGRIARFTIEDGHFDITIHLPPGSDTRRVLDVFKAEYPDTTVVANRKTTRDSDPAQSLSSVVSDELTEKQRAALEAAFFSGFFESPRENSGVDIAESLDISPSTFHHHIRAGERKLLRTLVERS